MTDLIGEITERTDAELLELERHFLGWIETYGETAGWMYVEHSYECLRKVQAEMDRRDYEARTKVESLNFLDQLDREDRLMYFPE